MLSEPPSRIICTIFALLIIGVMIYVPPIAILEQARSLTQKDPLTWVTTCNGRGLVYGDTPGGVCTCFGCWNGTTCLQQINNCVLDLTVGQPGILTEFWAIDHRAAVNIVPDYRTFYPTYNYLPALLPAITQLHDMNGNCNYTGKTLVIGYGAIQLYSAVIWAIRQKTGHTMNVFAQAPYEPNLIPIANFDPAISQFNGSLYQDPSTVIEFVQHPNNPDSELRYTQFPNASYAVYDLSYYWKSMTIITKQLNCPIMIFSTSYLTGHAGSRFGWAWIQDPQIAAYMETYITSTTSGISADSQYRILTIFNFIITKNTGFFDLAKLEMDRRWGQIQNVFSAQDLPQPYTLANKVFSGVYLWIKCNLPTETNCTEVFQQSAGILGVSGELFGLNSSYVRFNYAHFTFIADATALGIQNYFFVNKK